MSGVIQYSECAEDGAGTQALEEAILDSPRHRLLTKPMLAVAGLIALGVCAAISMRSVHGLPEPTAIDEDEDDFIQANFAPNKVTYYDLDGKNCPAGEEIMTKDGCLKAAKAMGLQDVTWSGFSGGIISASHIPPGCWTRKSDNACWKDRSCVFSVNSKETGSNNGDYKVYCLKPDYHDVDGKNCPIGKEIMTTDECKKAAKAMGLQDITWRGGFPNASIISALHVPPGCWTRKSDNACWKDRSCEFSVNTKEGGSNNGNYKAFCK